MPDEPFSLRLYRRLLKLYPAGFRENYGEALERQLRDELNESSSAAALGRLWIHLIADLAISVPLQLSREVRQDTKYTRRLWARRPWHTGFAILALAIGIGANTGVFSVVNALLLRSLPFQDPARLASLRNFFPPHDSTAQFHAWRGQSTYLADTALFETLDVNLGGGGEWRRAHVAQADSCLGMMWTGWAGDRRDATLSRSLVTDSGKRFSEVTGKPWVPQSELMGPRSPSLASRRRGLTIQGRLFSGSRQPSALATTAGR
jgi:hypothetical protein